MRPSIRQHPEQRHTPEEIHARLIFIIGITLAFVFSISVCTMLYSLVFVTQPINKQAPNDAAFIDLVSTLCVFMTGSLAGVLSANGLKSKPKEVQNETQPTE
jgi:hypothetical protein